MARARKVETSIKPYACYLGLSFSIVLASNIAEARLRLLQHLDLERKPWLATDWRVHPANVEEIARWNALLRQVPTTEEAGEQGTLL